VANVAAELGVGEQVLGRWVRFQREAAAAGDTDAVLDASQRAELQRLPRENAELRLDRECLKTVAANLTRQRNTIDHFLGGVAWRRLAGRGLPSQKWQRVWDMRTAGNIDQ